MNDKASRSTAVHVVSAQMTLDVGLDEPMDEPFEGEADG